MAELLLRPIDLAMDLGALEGIERDCGADQAPVLPADDRYDHLEIPQQLGEEGRGGIRRALLHFPEQLGIFQDPFPNRRRGVSPSGVQLSGFPTGELVLRKSLGHAGAVLGAGTCHGHQEFHGHMSRERTTPDLLLHVFREQLYQRQPVRYPTHTAIESARQLL